MKRNKITPTQAGTSSDEINIQVGKYLIDLANEIEMNNFTVISDLQRFVRIYL